MSRIKDALKRAKVEREDSAHITLADRPAPMDNNKPVIGQPQTRVINYSEEAVRKYKLIVPALEDVDFIEERFKLLKTKIFSEMQPNDNRTILITSCLAKEGKTFIAINLAITIAREVDQTILVVDVNLRNSSVLNFFGVRAEPGLTDFLLYDRPLSEVLIRPGIEKLVLLPAGKPVENSAELLRSLKMQELVKEMKYRYRGRYIIFDTPPVLSSVDAIVLSQYVDKTLFVIESGKVQPNKVSEALNHLEKEKILGAILNKKDSTSP